MPPEPRRPGCLSSGSSPPRAPPSSERLRVEQRWSSERALPGPLRGGAERLHVSRDRPPPDQRQPPRGAPARLLRGGVDRVEHHGLLCGHAPPVKDGLRNRSSAGLEGGEEISGTGAGDEAAATGVRSGSTSGCDRCAAPTGRSRRCIRSGSTSPRPACWPRPSAARLTEQNLYLQQEIKSVHNFEEIVGRSAPGAAGVLAKVRRVTPRRTRRF